MNPSCMEFDFITLIGFAAGTITSIGFIPQLIRGHRTKKLDDVSYFMPVVLAVGMTLWLIYGLLRQDLAIIIANGFGISCNLSLLFLKIRYSHAGSS
ncbi:MAG: SemiSWEET transporter [Euryarchaeota archaeon]|nr:SemiSWEET transporter [Euryarchaeota archaeon]